MTRIKNGGRELVVADSEVDEYLKEGYVVIDEKGNPLSKPKAVTYMQAVQENIVLKAQVKSLTAALEDANSQIVELSKRLKKIDAVVEGKPAEPKIGTSSTASPQEAVSTPQNIQTPVKRRSPSTTKPKPKAP